MKPADEERAALGGEGRTIEADVTYVGRKPNDQGRSRGGGSNMKPGFLACRAGTAARGRVHMPNVRVENLGAALENHASGKSDLDDRRSKRLIVQQTRLE